MIASLDCMHTRKWNTLRKLFEFKDEQNIIDYMKRRCRVDGCMVDDEMDTDDEILRTDTYRMTFRDMMCDEVFLYKRI